MSFWCVIRNLNFRSLPGRYGAVCCRIEATSSNPITTNNLVHASNIQDLVVCKRLTPIGCSVRFFAAPVQLNEKQGKKTQELPLMNENITYRYIRLVTEEGNFIVSRHEALQHAKELNLDLVEVQKEGNPPVCKLMDFQKERYKQKIKQKERAKMKTETLRAGVCKEVRFSTKIEQKDLQIKANMVIKLLERGYRVKCMATGSEDEDLSGLLERFSALIEGDSFIESGPRIEKKQAYVVVRHTKFGAPRKKGKKASKLGATTGADVEDGQIIGCESDDVMWSNFHATGDIVDVFGIKNDELENTAHSRDGHGANVSDGEICQKVGHFSGDSPRQVEMENRYDQMRSLPGGSSFKRRGVSDGKASQMAEIHRQGDSPRQFMMENRYKQRKNVPDGWNSGGYPFNRTCVSDGESRQITEVHSPGDSPPQLEMENRYKQRKNMPGGSRESSFNRIGKSDRESRQMAEAHSTGGSPPQIEMENRYKQRKNMPGSWNSGSRDFPWPNIHESRW